MTDLVTIDDICERFHVGAKMVETWQQRDDFPGPAGEDRIGPVWDWADIEQWADQAAERNPARRRKYWA